VKISGPIVTHEVMLYQANVVEKKESAARCGVVPCLCIVMSRIRLLIS